MRVLHAIAGAEFGGAETIAQDTIAALADSGIEQHVVTRPWQIATERFAATGVPVTHFGFSRVDSWLHRGVLKSAAKNFRADVVHAWMSRAASFVPADLPCPAAGWFGGYYDLKYYRHCDAAFGMTADIVAHIVKGGMPPERAFEIHSFGTLDAQPPADRAALATPADAPLVLVMSRLHEKKGIDTILHALARCPGLHLWIAGEGPKGTEYHALCTKLGLNDRVRFLGWRTDRAALYAAADMVALPSRYEPFGTVITEAWAASRPLIASRAAGAAAYVHDGVDGLLVPIGDVAALAQAMTRLAHDTALRARLIQGGQQAYERSFTKEAVVKSLLGAYETMLRLGKR
ncbi:MAG TPA: glycosyltransferase [Stellaceae bacterium]